MKSGHQPYRTIIIGRNTHFLVKVSPEDYDFLMQWKWTFARSHGQWSGLVYARRSIKASDGSNVTVLMHRVILLERMKIGRPSEMHFTDHENGDSLDNRRFVKRTQQLRWLTAKEQMTNRRNVISRPIDYSAAESIPY